MIDILKERKKRVGQKMGLSYVLDLRGVMRAWQD